MSEKYLLSIYFKDFKHNVFSEPFGIFDSFSEAQHFADEKMDQMKFDITQEVNLTWEEVEELYEFDFTIKKILI
jgi:hypothetical protein